MQKINLSILAIFFMFMLGIVSCDNDDDLDTGENTESTTDETGTDGDTDGTTEGGTTDSGSLLCDALVTAPNDILILNEGGFGSSNATISALSEVQEGLVQDLVGTLGDVAQSITFHGGNVYVVVNNSGKIEVFCQYAYEAIATIEGFPSPRFMSVVNDEKAYVSNYYSESISIVDLTNNTILGSIDYAIENNGFGERNSIEIAGEYAYIVDADNYGIAQINTTTDTFEGFIATTAAPREMVKDADGNLWVFAFDYDANFAIINTAIYKIDTASNTIADTFTVPYQPGYTSTYLQINESGDELYLLLDEVYETSTSAFNLVQLADIPDTVFPYGFGVSETEQVFITDPIDYSQEGKLIEIDNSGTSVNEYTVGVVPSKIYFLD